MPLCAYVVVPRQGALPETRRSLSMMAGCEVHPAEKGDVLLLLTDTDSYQADVALRRRLERVPGIEALLMTFGEIDPDTPVADPVREARP